MTYPTCTGEEHRLILLQGFQSVISGSLQGKFLHCPELLASVYHVTFQRTYLPPGPAFGFPFSVSVSHSSNV